MTERLYYLDSYLSGFEARITHRDGTRIYLDRTAFYPTSGGQPFDTGTLGGVAVMAVVDEDDQIAHVLAAPLSGDAVSGHINWDRRFDHMQQHTGQHLLSAVFADLFQAQTVSFHLGADACTIDLAVGALEPAQVQTAERRANELVFENRVVTVEFQDASEASGLRKHSKREGTLRIVAIDGLDRSACGGTHVRATGEIGPILIRKLDKVRGQTRVEFLCGMRAVRRARADYEALAQIARSFSAPLDETPGLVAGLIERVADSDKARKKLSAELAAARGRELYVQTDPHGDGVRRLMRRAASLGEEQRVEAQAFAAGPKSAILMLGAEPPSVLLAVSSDSGVNAGQWLKAVLAQLGGRGGGSATMAQGSVPSPDALDAIAAEFQRLSIP